MNVRLIQVPYDSGRYRTRMGKGPGCFLDHGVVERLETAGHQVAVATVEPGTAFPAEVATSFDLMVGVAHEVRSAVAAQSFPLVLAGNCNTSVGTVGGLAPRQVGVVWFDAHADFNTPESTGTGFLDGMGLAVLSGHCWTTLAQRVPGFAPVPEDRVILAGARDFDVLERDRLVESQIVWISDGDVRRRGVAGALTDALVSLAARVDVIYLHIDLDVHDAKIAPANHFRPPGGLRPEDVRDAVELIAGHVDIAAAAVTAYDPDVDDQGVTLNTGLALIETIVAAGASSRASSRLPRAALPRARRSASATRNSCPGRSAR